MIRSLYTATSGMLTESKKLDIISNNLANVNTTGFKKDELVTKAFDDFLVYRISAGEPPVNIGVINPGVGVNEIYTNFYQGSLLETHNPLDLAISGGGYFAVETPNGIRYTRDGSFLLNKDNLLVTKEGYPVLGENGYITLGSGNISINEKGEIYLNDELVDRLKLVDFEDPNVLRKQGDNLFYTEGDVSEKEADGRIMQGFLESSNVNAVKEMVDMITVLRTYESNSKIVQSLDQTLDKAVNEIGRV